MQKAYSFEKGIEVGEGREIVITWASIFLFLL
jgi:hypothetical protein